MNVLEYELVETLKRLKEEYGVIQIKAEYENEGSRQVELCRLKDVISKVDLPLIIKIGGVEAVSNMYEALTIGAKGIVAPMAETAYALSKFLDGVEKFIPKDNREDIEFAVNIETIDAWNNFDDMLELENIDVLQSVTVGRVDFTGSIGMDRDFADTEDMLKYCQDIFGAAKEKGLRTALGGAISPESEQFIRLLAPILNKYETRKVVYDIEGLKTYNEGLLEGIKFELLWLRSKRRYYHLIAAEDEKRINMLEKRLG